MPGREHPVSKRELAREACALYELGCRYFHYHARNFETREQTTENEVYAYVGRMVRSACPDMVISFGASRNGSEVIQNISSITVALSFSSEIVARWLDVFGAKLTKR